MFLTTFQVIDQLKNAQGKEAELDQIEACTDLDAYLDNFWEGSAGLIKPRLSGVSELEKKKSLPANFKLMDSAPALELYADNDDFVIVADLAEGASLQILPGDKVDSGKVSAYGGPNPDFKRMSAEDAFARVKLSRPGAFALLNSQFFANLNSTNVPVAFAFRKDGLTESEGFASPSKHEGKRSYLAWDYNAASIELFDNQDISKFRNLKAEQAVVSLSPTVNIDGQKDAKIGRSYLGLVSDSEQGNNKYTKLVFFVSPRSTQAHAESTLSAFGAGPKLMLDGGGSSQLRWRGGKLVQSNRTVPQFLVLVPAPFAR